MARGRTETGKLTVSELVNCIWNAIYQALGELGSHHFPPQPRPAFTSPWSPLGSLRLSLGFSSRTLRFLMFLLKPPHLDFPPPVAFPRNLTSLKPPLGLPFMCVGVSLTSLWPPYNSLAASPNFPWRALPEVIELRDWAEAFRRDGFGVAQDGLAERVKKALGDENLYVRVSKVRPSLDQLHIVFPRRVRIPIDLLWQPFCQLRRAAPGELEYVIGMMECFRNRSRIGRMLRIN